MDTDCAVCKPEELQDKIKDSEVRQVRTRDSVECEAWKAEVEDGLRKGGGPAHGTELDRKRDEVTRGGTNLYGDAGA